MPLDIIYEDNHIIVINKDRGVLSQGDKTCDEDLMILTKKYLIEKYNKKGDAYLGMVQRLDRVTSGVILYAKTSKAQSRLTKIFKDSNVGKTYLAVMEGKIKNKKGKLIDYLIKDSKRNISNITQDKNRGKYSELDYEVISEREKFSLMKVKLITGRSHQIRVQFSARGVTIVGDKKYHNNNIVKSGICLHSFMIELVHPVKREKMRFLVKPPEDEYFGLFSKEIEEIYDFERRVR